MDFLATDYGPTVLEILAMGEHGLRPMPLAPSGPSSIEAKEHLKTLSAAGLFPEARAPEAALCGLYLYFSCLDEGHTLAQALETPDGSFWHGIMHRQEPDAENAAYWFRRVGKHPVFPTLAAAARGLGYPAGEKWDPLGFIDYCEAARRRPGSREEKLAMQVQLVEWQILFDYCAAKLS